MHLLVIALGLLFPRVALIILTFTTDWLVKGGFVGLAPVIGLCLAPYACLAYVISIGLGWPGPLIVFMVVLGLIVDFSEERFMLKKK